MELRYRSGEEIKKGDKVLFHRNAATVEFVVTERTSDGAFDWYIEEFGGGVAINDPVSGKCFIPASEIPEYEDLEFVSRQESDSR